ncbi:MAG: DctP family TRAP transporter solute-binding subunit [Deltaproteobacteria bacterium]|nr:DctP family TRAP transporter solute-binding subunit [Deltaproteobacteria bacterium]
MLLFNHLVGRVFCLTFGFLTLWSIFGGISTSEAKIVFRSAQVLASDHPIQLGLNRLATILEEKTNGELTLDIMEPGQFGSERELIEAIQMGDLDLIVITTPPLYSFTNAFLAFDLPYIFPDTQVARTVLDGPFGQDRLKAAANIGLVGITYFENGLRHISSLDKPIIVPWDLKGLKIRTMESRIHLYTFRTLGANPVPLAYNDLYQNLKNKTLDGQENPPSVFITGKLYEVQKHYSLTGHFYITSPMFVSSSAWNKLTPEQQVIFTNSAQEAKYYQRFLADQINDIDYLKRVAPDVTIHSSLNLNLWKSNLVDPIRHQFQNEIGIDTLKELDLEIQRALDERIN